MLPHAEMPELRTEAWLPDDKAAAWLPHSISHRRCLGVLRPCLSFTAR
jgi:hypothetical protein